MLRTAFAVAASVALVGCGSLETKAALVNVGDTREVVLDRMGAPVDRQTHFEGRLGGVENDAIVIETKPGKRQLIPLALVTRARLEVEF